MIVGIDIGSSSTGAYFEQYETCQVSWSAPSVVLFEQENHPAGKEWDPVHPGNDHRFDPEKHDSGCREV